MLNFEQPHLRTNILTGGKILVSPHRSKRPWQGQVEDIHEEQRQQYDETCYLCPGNKRAEGQINPNYSDSFVFTNDFSALLDSTEEETYNENNLLKAEAEKGICKVIAFSPRHDLTLPELEVDEIKKVVDVWQNEFSELAKNEWIKYIQIFENKGAIMGCSNPHPHGQIWSQQSLPSEIVKETKQQKEYFEKNGKSLLTAYWQQEEKEATRVVINNEHFIVVVPFWAAWPYETLVISKRHMQDISQFTEEEKKDLAKTLK
ncbi:MAG: galactose-1-phosphate uridylyltransferase, partial [Empedobacter falsenii]